MFYARLARTFHLPLARIDSHDDLQAVVAALPAAALVGAHVQPQPHGDPCRRISHARTHYRVEGVIWDARPRAI